MRKFIAVIGIVMLVSAAGFASTSGGPQRLVSTVSFAQSAEEVLHEAAKAYKDISSLSVVQTNRFFVEQYWDKRTPITIYFRRPNWLRVEVKDADGRVTLLVAREGKAKVRHAAQPWELQKPPIREEPSLSSALTDLVGGMEIEILPALLGLYVSPNANPLLWRIKGLHIAAEGKYDGDICYRIEGTVRKKGQEVQVTYWIDKKTHMLRRIKQQSRFVGLPLTPSMAKERELWEKYGGEQAKRTTEAMKKQLAEMKGKIVIREDSFDNIKVNPSLHHDLFELPR